VFCQELNAYIAIPATPSKYLKWLRQRRAATKEIRNMMRIGRHRNVVHLFEVLELIQENKSTMFLILELVRGGELFDLISSNAAKISENDKIPDGFSESETVMRKFFRELASGINYCHQNGIAHRDLKPENLLVHNSRNGDCVLKIADFGLSAVFGDGTLHHDTGMDSSVSLDGTYTTGRHEADAVPSSPSPIKLSVDKLLTASGSALSYITCGTVDVISCAPRLGPSHGGPSPLKRMTSVVGSPHYVAPEIISQSDSSRRIKKEKTNGGEQVVPSKQRGYDGTKADVWSAGVILYAMLFRSLPFGEDLLRCPRFQSYRKWYEGIRKAGVNRRNTAMGALNPMISDVEERDLLGPHWFFPSSSSRESRDLIVYMLNPDPDIRPNIELVLQHPWLLKQAL
jgi:serine/threonine protein kinase